MKLSNKARYAVRALFDIAYYNSGAATQVRDIAERQAIPPRFLEQIFQDLKRAGIVASKRGPQGGYSLAIAANAVSLGDVVRAIEGPIGLGREKDAKDRAGASRESGRVIHATFEDLSERVEACFDEVTVQDMCERAEKLGVRRRPGQRYVYVI